MHGGGSAPSCCAFTHRVAFEEGSGPRVWWRQQTDSQETVGRTFGLGNRMEEMGERAGGVIILIITGFGECVSEHVAVP